MKLKESQIEFIIRDLRERGLIFQPLHDEIVDHVCTMIETELDKGLHFRDAYRKVLGEFGPKNELDTIQQQIVNNDYSNPRNMIKNYFKTALRNLKKHKFYGIINVVGLSIGIACTLLISLYILDELSYDKYNVNGDRIYRVISHLKFGGNDSRLAVCPAPMAKAIRDEIPEIENSARFRSWGSFLVKKDKENIKEYNVVWADPEVFEIFTIPLIEGNPKTVLRDPNTLVISESTAKKYFGDEDPMNQILTLNNDMVYKVTGVYKDIPQNSHFHFSMMLAMDGLKESKVDMWLSNNFHTYFLLRKGSDPQAVQKKINDIIYKYAGPQVKQFLGKSIEELIAQGTLLEEIVQPLYDIHLYSNSTVEFEANHDIRYLYIFSAVALFILLLAVINFMNLSTARSADRAREVGIRKAMGASTTNVVSMLI